MKALRAGLIAFVLVAACIAYFYAAPFRLLVLYAIGRSPVCPLRQALASADNLRREVLYRDAILKASKLLATDRSGFELWQTPKGRFWVPGGSRYVLPFNLAEQQRQIYGTGENGPRAGDIVLDCGANVGVTVNEELAAGAQKIVAIEPAPENIECLRRNFQNEVAEGRVIVYPKGVWNREDFLTLRVDPQNSAADSFVMQRSGTMDVQSIPVTTIDKIVGELKLPRVDYIKFDIEGAEAKALDGARETIVRFKPRISIATYHRPEDPRVIPETLNRDRPDYVVECGPCAEASHGIRPDVLYFR